MDSRCIRQVPREGRRRAGMAALAWLASLLAACPLPQPDSKEYSCRSDAECATATSSSAGKNSSTSAEESSSTSAGPIFTGAVVTVTAGGVSVP